MFQNQQVIIEMSLLDFYELILDVFDAIDSPIDEDFMFRHNL